MAKATTKNNDTGANLGFEAKLWQMADALRNNMDAAEYKHVVLGLIFLKYISDAFEAKYAELNAQKVKGADPEDPDEYRAVSIFWVPPEARWKYLKSMAPQPTIGQLVDDAMSAIERDNSSLKGVLPKDFARPGLDKQRLGQIINLVSDISFHPSPAGGRGAGGEGGVADTHRSKDTLGRVYEYFLARFASAEGKSGGQFYTPSRVVRVLVEMLAPYKGRVYDPCCGSGGMFVSSEKFIEAHSGKLGDISIYGQESNYTTWRLAKINLAIRGIDAQIGHGDAFHNNAHPDLKADYVLANPPFNDSDWRGALLKNDKRWAYGGEGVAIYRDIPGFCKAAKLDDIRKHGHVLTPGRYVGAEEIEDDGVPFEEKMQRLVAQLDEQFAESAKLEKQIKLNLATLGLALEQTS